MGRRASVVAQKSPRQSGLVIRHRRGVGITMTDSAGRAAGEYVVPPHQFTDDVGREIRVSKASVDDVEELVDLYEVFNPEDRSQGVPPQDEESIREWLDYLFPDHSQHVIARHKGDAIGHAFLVPAGDDRHELAIFVLREYQSAHIGTELMYTLLGYGLDEGVVEVWLSVESWNNHAIALYEKVGFQKHRVARTEVEMTIRLRSENMR
jgi:GNAT superfamily N-acetyltransferase